MMIHLPSSYKKIIVLETQKASCLTEKRDIIAKVESPQQVYK